MPTPALNLPFAQLLQGPPSGPFHPLLADTFVRCQDEDEEEEEDKQDLHVA